MARISKDRKLRLRYAVLGDGQTEQHYLDHLKTINGYGYSIKPSLFNRITLDEAGDIIEELLSSGCNKIIYLTDYDTVVSDGKLHQFCKLEKKYKASEKVIICESMPSIEFWFLMHFQYTTREFGSAGEVEKALKKYIPDYKKEQRSFLSKQEWVKFLCSENKMDCAIMNAEKLMKIKEQGNVGTNFPFTKVQNAIIEFENLKNGGINLGK